MVLLFIFSEYAMKLRFTLVPVLSLAVVILSGCMYRPDLTQGNIFTPDQVAQIQSGMSREQVHELLGTPAIQDPFHKDMDSYIFTFKSGTTGRLYKRRLTITYVDNQVASKTESPVTIEKR